MNIPSSKYLKIKAKNRLESGKDPQKTVLVFSGIVAGSTFLVNLVQYAVDSQISQTGGLQNIGLRSALTTLNSIAPLLFQLLLMCVGLGYVAAMLRIARHQYASPKTLKAGAERFWVLLRSKLLMGLIYFGIAFALSYAAMGIFMVTPWANAFSELVMPMILDGSFTPDLLLSDNALVDSIMAALSPMMLIYVLLLIPAYLFVSYFYRLTDYFLIDQPRAGALNAMRQSRQTMQGNKWNLFKIDLSFWWYYLLRMVNTTLQYLLLILAMFGISLPVSPAASFFGVMLLYLAAEFAINVLLRNRVEVTYALVYDTLVPRQIPDNQNGAVLGNIFQM